MTTSKHEKGAATGAEQVAALVDSPSENIQLCDIIAQQREFQRRQDTRQQLANLHEQQQQQHFQQQASGEQPPASKSKLAGRRKFSLSYAMSNLASLTGASSSSGNLASETPTKRPLPPVRPARGLQHRASLVTGGSAGVGVASNERASGSSSSTSQQESVEKKKGFVHKAIRRGSKMFDAMLLSSSQQQACAKQDQRRKKSTGSLEESGSNSVSPERDAAGNGAGSGGGGQRVQFASSIDEHEEQAKATGEQEFAKKRKPRLRLGSIPHDLRRALSLSNNSQKSAAGSERHPMRSTTEPETGSSRRAELAEAEQPGSPSKPELPRAGPLDLAAGLGGGLRLGRKNSLFSPLSHAVTHYGSHRTGQQQQAQETALAKAASNTSGQSASFTLCQDHNRTYKLIIFGSSAVGKTSLIQRFLYGQFPVAHKPTVEELHSNKYNIPELGEIYLEILDTSGTFEFPAMRRLSIEKGDAFILVFSISDEQSWEEVKHLRQLILEEKLSQEASGELVPSAPARDAPDREPATELMGSRPALAEPINSVYAAAAKLTTGRRFSVAPEVSLQAGSRVPKASVERRASQALPSARNNSSSPKQVIATDKAPSSRPEEARPFTHYSSQLSKVLQQRSNGSHRRSRNRNKPSLLEQSLSLEDDDASASSSSSSSSSSSDALSLAKRKPARSSGAGRAKKTSGSAEKERGAQKRLRCRTPIVVVANKCDLVPSLWKVDQEEARRLVCEVWGNSLVSCSAKEALNIDEVFKELLRQARAPEILSQFVIDDHQQRRQSLPVLKNHLSAHHVKGLRSLYQQQGLAASSSGAGSSGGPGERPISQAGGEEAQCRII